MISILPILLSPLVDDRMLGEQWLPLVFLPVASICQMHLYYPIDASALWIGSHGSQGVAFLRCGRRLCRFLARRRTSRHQPAGAVTADQRARERARCAIVRSDRPPNGTHAGRPGFAGARSIAIARRRADQKPRQ